MFDFLKSSKFSKTVISNGRKWTSILVLPNGYHLAVLPTKQSPAEVYLIKEDEDQKL